MEAIQIDGQHQKNPNNLRHMAKRRWRHLPARLPKHHPRRSVHQRGGHDQRPEAGQRFEHEER